MATLQPPTSSAAGPNASGTKRDFFVSYTADDRDWAVWVAYELESLGFSVHIQDWDFLPGSNFMEQIDRAAEGSRRTIAILSKRYLEKAFPRLEMLTTMAKDPLGHATRLIPVRIEPFEVTGILIAVVYIDLANLSEDEARLRLRRGILLTHRETRAKPSTPPSFPSTGQGLPATSTALTTPLSPPKLLTKTSRFIHERVLANDWLNASSIGQPYTIFSDPTDATQIKPSSAVTCTFWMPNDQYFTSGSITDYTPAVAICTPDPQTFLRLVIQGAGSESFAKLSMPPSKLHNEDRENALKAVGAASNSCLIACIAVPKSIMEPARQSASLGIQILSALLIAPILTLHTKLGIRELSLLLPPSGLQTGFLLSQTKRLSKAILAPSGIRSTVSITSESTAFEYLGYSARLLAWASSCAHNAGNSRWIETLQKEIEKVDGGVSRLETPPPC